MVVRNGAADGGADRLEWRRTASIGLRRRALGVANFWNESDGGHSVLSLICVRKRGREMSMVFER